MKKEMLFITVTLSVVILLAGLSLAQEKKGDHREGVILPESTPPKGGNIVWEWHVWII